MLSLSQLAEVLGYTRRQLQNYVSRNRTDYYPPSIPTKPGFTKLWLKRVVEKWLDEKAAQSVHLEGTQEKKKRGRPRKVAA